MTQQVQRADTARARAAAAAPAIGNADAAELPGLVIKARRRYQATIAAPCDADWTRYGEEIRHLGDLLERMGRRYTGRHVSPDSCP